MNRLDRKEHTLAHFLRKTCSGCSFPMVKISDDWYIVHDELLCTADRNTNGGASANADPLFIHVPIKSESDQPYPVEENEEILEQKCFAEDEHSVALESEPIKSEDIDIFAEETTTKPLKLRRNVNKRNIRCSNSLKRPPLRRIRCGICKNISNNAWSFKRHMKTVHCKTNTETNGKCIDIGGQKLTILDEHNSDDLESGTKKFVACDNYKKPSLRPIRCGKCERVLKTEWCFKRHVKSIHKNDRSCVGVRLHKVSIDVEHLTVAGEPNGSDDIGLSDTAESSNKRLNVKMKRGSLQNTIPSRRRIRCKMCKKTLTTLWSLKRHMKNVHNGESKAEGDNAESVDIGGQQMTIVNEHSSMEDGPNDYEAVAMEKSNSLQPIQCEMCKNILRNKWSFKRHVKTIHKNVPNCVGVRLENVLVNEDY